jgi:uncharacterized membrane protein
VADLIAIGYPDETTAIQAAEEAERLAEELIIQPDAIAAIVRRQDGKFEVKTSHHPVATGASWGAGFGALMGRIEKSGIDKQFQQQVRDMLQPGTSALFLIVEKVTPDKAVAALSKFGGTVLKSSLSKETEEALQDALHGERSEALA